MGVWITLAGTDMRLLDTEKTQMEAVNPLQDMDDCVGSASATARGYVEGGGNTMEPSPAVPAEVVDDVLAIARFNYLTQDPTGTLLTPMRQKEYEYAMAHLRDISAEKSSVTQGVLPPGTTDITIGSWGSIDRLPMRTETSLSPPP